MLKINTLCKFAALVKLLIISGKGFKLYPLFCLYLAYIIVELIKV